jgi:arginyl-tRNA synthetase
MLKNDLSKIVQKVVGQVFPDHADDPVEIEYPTDPTHGDYSCNSALRLAKKVGKNPREVAQSIVAAFEKPDFIQTIEIAGPGFINFYVAPEYLVGNLRGILSGASDYGQTSAGAKKKVMIEYSQPNTNKPMHIGHMRNNFLGMAVANLLGANGYESIPVNYVGDIGIHIAKSMLGYEKWGRSTSPESSDAKGDYFVGKFYKQFEKELQKVEGGDQELMEQAQEIVRKWEKEDPATRELWNKMNDWVYDGWTESYERQGCRFEHYFYESTYNDSGKEIAKEALEKGIAERAENGAIIAKLEDHGYPDKVLLRGDGTSIYATKDLKLAEENFAEFGLDGRIYVVASQQKLYLEQVFKILELLGYEYASRCFHLAYGVVGLPDGMMSSRKGNVIYADDLMNEVHNLAYEQVKKRNTDKDEKWLHKTAELITVGALKYAILKIDPTQNITYDPKESVRFDGDTGPYLQYTHARIKSILRRTEDDNELLNKPVSAEHLVEPEEIALLRKLQLFPEVVASAMTEYRVNTIANYLHDLAALFNSFYTKHQVLDAPTPEKRIARLQLIAAVAQVLKNGLAILGIEAPERM